MRQIALMMAGIFAALLSASEGLAQSDSGLLDCTCIRDRCSAVRFPQNQVWAYANRGETFQNMIRGVHQISGGGRVEMLTGTVNGAQVRLSEEDFQCLSASARIQQEEAQRRQQELRRQQAQAERQRLARFEPVRHIFGCDPENLWRWESLDGLLTLDPDLDSCLTDKRRWNLVRRGYAPDDEIGADRMYAGIGTHRVYPTIGYKGQKYTKERGKISWSMPGPDSSILDMGTMSQVPSSMWYCERDLGEDREHLRCQPPTLETAPAPYGRVPLPPEVADVTNYSVFVESKIRRRGSDSYWSHRTEGYWVPVGRPLPSRVGVTVVPADPEPEGHYLPDLDYNPGPY